MARTPKYTVKYVREEVKEIWGRLKADPKGTYITWQDLIKDKTYSRQRISEWRSNFKGSHIISDTFKKIDAELENRLYKLALAGKINAAVAIFGLKNNYGWKDRQELTGADGKDLIPPARTLTKEEAKHFLKEIENGY